MNTQPLADYLNKEIVKKANQEAMIAWANTPNLVSPPVTLGKKQKNSIAWYVLINNMVRESRLLLNELRP